MTVQEAINVLDKYTDITLSKVVIEAHNIGIKALEKQIPKKPLNIQGTPTWGYCPNCCKQITKLSCPVGCKWCLQRLEWMEGGE